MYSLQWIPHEIVTSPFISQSLLDDTRMFYGSSMQVYSHVYTIIQYESHVMS